MAPEPSPGGNETKPRSILFDWDNTLVDSWPIIHDALNVTFETFGLKPWSLEETRTRVRKSLRDSFPGLFGDKWQAAGDVFYDRYGAIHVEKLKPLSGADEMLEALHRKGIHLAVLSNKKGDYLRKEARHLGWDRYFGAMIGALDAEKDKPSPEPVDLALKGSGIERGPEVWIVGDADIDLECAHNAGCTPILVREQAPGPGELDTHPPARHFPDCDALCKFVINL
ncbi:MAG: HAD family hydrolase [Rhodospirillales bacterium]